MTVNYLNERLGPDSDWRSLLAAYGEAHKMKRVAQPSEIAKAVVSLSRDDAAFIAGSAVVVDAGFSVQRELERICW